MAMCNEVRAADRKSVKRAAICAGCWRSCSRKVMAMPGDGVMGVILLEWSFRETMNQGTSAARSTRSRSAMRSTLTSGGGYFATSAGSSA